MIKKKTLTQYESIMCLHTNTKMSALLCYYYHWVSPAVESSLSTAITVQDGEQAQGVSSKPD